ncbi:MAG: methyl-accepting chemotaxis protein, partial [Cystobacter sp.]
MEQVDEVTQKNASAAEELSSTAEELAAQAESLRQMMTFFRMAEGEPPRGQEPRAYPAVTVADVGERLRTVARDVPFERDPSLFHPSAPARSAAASPRRRMS